MAVAAVLGARVFAQSLVLTVGAIEVGSLRIKDVKVVLDDVAGGSAWIEVGTLSVGERVWQRVRLHCDDLALKTDSIECGRASLMLPTRGAAQRTANLSLGFSYRFSTRTLDLDVQPAAGERWTLHSGEELGGRRSRLVLQAADLERLPLLMPLPDGWQAGGKVSGEMGFDRGLFRGDLRLSDARLSNAAGTYAGDKLAAQLHFEAKRKGDAKAPWHWMASIDWTAGEAYAQPIYLNSDGIRAEASGFLDRDELHIEQAHLDAGALGAASLNGVWSVERKHLLRARFDTSRLDLERLAPVLISPLLEQVAGPKLEWTGATKMQGEIVDGTLSGIDVELNKVGIKESDGRYAIREASGRLPWRVTQKTQAHIEIGSAQWAGLPIGRFVLPFELQGRSFELSRVEAPVLDGKLILEDIRFAYKTDGPHWRGAIAVTPISMQHLSAALGWPRMDGVFSASIPGILQHGSEIALEGALVVQVFDGFAQVTDLKLTEPFGRTPRLFADVEIRGLDLELLTRTFSFGSITGRIDGDLKGLELAGLKPQRFNARIVSSPGTYRKRISQRAVQNIGALGGAGAAAAIQRSVLRIFEEFSYGKLGWSCILRNGVCEMGGVADAPSGYVIVQGAGIPAINVIGYNRRVDWEELLARLKRVTDANAKPVIN